MDVLMPKEESLQRTINPTIYSTGEFKLKLAQESSFLTRVMDRPKLMIKGLTDDSGKSASN